MKREKDYDDEISAKICNINGKDDKTDENTPKQDAGASKTILKLRYGRQLNDVTQRTM